MRPTDIRSSSFTAVPRVPASPIHPKPWSMTIVPVASARQATTSTSVARVLSSLCARWNRSEPMHGATTARAMVYATREA